MKYFEKHNLRLTQTLEIFYIKQNKKQIKYLICKVLKKLKLLKN